MEKTNLTTCPKCGTLGFLGRKCEFCGSELPGSRNEASESFQLPRKKSISSEDFYKRLDTYRKLEKVDQYSDYVDNASISWLGDYYGVVDRDFNIIVPVEYDEIINLEGKYFLLRKGEKQLFNIFCVSRLKFVSDGNGNREVVYVPHLGQHESPVFEVGKAGWLLYEKDGYYFLYNPNKDSIIKLASKRQYSLRPLGRGFACFDENEDLGEFSYRTYQFANECGRYIYSDYISDSGESLNPKHYHFTFDTNTRGDDIIQWQVLEQLGYLNGYPNNSFVLDEDSDSAPQFKKMLQFIDKEVEKYVEAMKKRKQRSFIIIAAVIVLIIIVIAASI